MTSFEDGFSEFQVWETQNVYGPFKMELEITQDSAVMGDQSRTKLRTNRSMASLGPEAPH